MKLNSGTSIRINATLDQSEQFLTPDGSAIVTEISAMFDTFKDGTTCALYICQGFKRTKSGAFGARLTTLGVMKSGIPSTLRDEMVTEARKSLGVVLGRLDLESTRNAITTDWNSLIQGEIK